MQRPTTSLRPAARPLTSAQLAIISGAPLYVRLATPADLGVIKKMINDARARLKDIGTDQWSTDWPDENGHKRDDRIVRSLTQGTTWLALHVPQHRTALRAIPVATVSIDKAANSQVWADLNASERALYLSRLVIAEGFSGLHIGTAILDWAARYGAREYRAQWIRIDVWTTNFALHAYYQKRGFQRCGLVPDLSYPARSRFQRPTARQLGDGPRVIEFGGALQPCPHAGGSRGTMTHERCYASGLPRPSGQRTSPSHHQAGEDCATDTVLWPACEMGRTTRSAAGWADPPRTGSTHLRRGAD